VVHESVEADRGTGRPGTHQGLSQARRTSVTWRPRRSAEQWPLLLANGVSVIGGVAFLIAAAIAHPKLGMIAIYAATGGTEFVIQAWLLARRRRRLANADPVLSAS
jgi:Na+/proline symporter